MDHPWRLFPHRRTGDALLRDPRCIHNTSPVGGIGLFPLARYPADTHALYGLVASLQAVRHWTECHGSIPIPCLNSDQWWRPASKTRLVANHAPSSPLILSPVMGRGVILDQQSAPWPLSRSCGASARRTRCIPSSFFFSVTNTTFFMTNVDPVFDISIQQYTRLSIPKIFLSFYSYEQSYVAKICNGLCGWQTIFTHLKLYKQAKSYKSIYIDDNSYS